MRILVFCYEFPPLGGGAGNALSHLAEEWVKSGHTVTVVTSHYAGMARVEVLNGIKLLRLPAARKQLHQGRKREMLLFGLNATFSSGSIFRSEKPEVCVIFMTVPGGGLAPFLLKWFHGVPIVTEIRGADMPGYDTASLQFHHWFLQPFIRFSWKQSKAVICVNSMFSELVKKNCPSAPSAISIPNGVNSDFYVPPVQKRSGEGLNLLFVGRFVDSQKNIKTLLKALSGTDKAVLYLAGSGPDEKSIKSFADKIGVFGKIHFLNWLDKRALLAVYQAADVYVSAASSEGMPNTVLEAMACGLPLLLSEIPGHSELVENGKNGYLFKTHDPAELGRLIDQMRKDTAARLAMGAESRQRAVKDHNWKILAEKHAVYFKK